MIVLLALSLVTAPAMKALLETPELLPAEVWKQLPLPDSEMSTEEITELNRNYGGLTTHEPKFVRAHHPVFSQAPVLNAEAGAGTLVRPTLLEKPVLLAQTAPAPAPAAAEPAEPDVPSPRALPNRASQQTLQDIQHEAGRNQAQAEQQEAEAKSAYDRALAGIDYQPGQSLYVKTFTTGSTGRNLIIRSSETDPKSLAATEEDLSVMGRILAKAAAKTGGDEENKAMGIRITTLGGGGVKNLQIEGYGVIFLLKANFPLAGPPAKVAEEKPKEPGNSTWEDAKEELYGSPETTEPRQRRLRPGGPAVEYDPKRVEQLENSLLEAMKNASNIRALKDGESVTVTVTSGENGSIAWEDAGIGNNAFIAPGAAPNSIGNGGYGWSSAAPGGVAGGGGGRGGGEPGHKAGHAGTTLTIRAKKSDVDAFFRGKLNLEDFRRKATIALY